MSEQSWYLFCIAGGEQPPAVAPELAVVTYHDLHAVVRPASPEEFECVEPDSDGNLPPELTALLIRHDQVIRSVFAQCSVLPMRFGTGVTDPDGLRRYLAAEYAALKARLDVVREQAEWGVRWAAPPEAKAKAPAPAQESGRGYLRGRSQELRAGQERLRNFRNTAERAHRQLAALATAALPGTRSADEIGCAYLVHRASEESFLVAAEALTEECAGAGVTMRLTGPWPPYSFAAEPKPGDEE